MLIRIILLSFLMLLASCGNHEKLKIGQGPAGGGSNDTDQVAGSDAGDMELPVTALMFSDIYDNIIGPNCMVCHSKQKYDDYNVVKSMSVKMLGMVLTNRMPEDFTGSPDPLPQDLKDMFEEWVNAGSPEFGSEDL